MQFIKHSAVRLSLAAILSIGMAWGLSACGGSDGDEPDFAVTATVQGESTPGTTLAAGQSASLSVPSGATLVFASEGETRWAPSPANASFTVGSFSWTSKSMTVQSNGGGTIVIAFSDKADGSQRGTLTLNVAPRFFERVPVVQGESAEWRDTIRRRDGSEMVLTRRTRAVVLGDDNSYGLESLTAEGTATSRVLYDNQDRTLGTRWMHSERVCDYDNPLPWVAYPLQVGKTWSGQSTRTCTEPLPDGSLWSASARVNYERTVEAFEKITVSSLTYSTLRIRSESTYLDDNNLRITRTCWWNVATGRNIRCESVYHQSADAPGAATDSVTEEIVHYTRP